MSNWFRDSYKNLFFDFHTQSSATGVAEGFDAGAWADGIKSFGAQSVSAFAVDAFGWRFYRKGDNGWVHPGLPEGVDLLGDITKACHERGIRVIAYFNSMSSEPVALHRPEFREIDSSGRPKSDYEIIEGIVVCWMSEAFDEIFLPQIIDLATNYELDALFFDGMFSHTACYCGSCTTRYREELGRELPRGADDPGWSDYAVWAERNFERIRDRIVETVVSIRPTALVCVNCYTGNHLPAVIKRPENMFLNIDLGPATQLLDASYQARSWSSQDTPWTCQNTGFLDWWGDWGVKSPVALKQECASILSNGGRLFTGYQLYPDLRIHPGYEAALREMLAFADERIPSVAGTEAHQEIAVLHPTTAYTAKDPVIFTGAERAERLPASSNQLGLPHVFADEGPVRGAHRMLLELGYDFQIVTESVLLENLERYRVVILPGERYVTDELIGRLTEFAERGGLVIATYEPSRIDKEREDKWTAFLGVNRDHDYEFNHAFVASRDAQGTVADPFLVRSAFTLATPRTGANTLADHINIYVRGDGKPLLKTSPPDAPSGFSAVTSLRVGQGLVVNFNFEPFSAYLRTNQWRLKELLSGLLEREYPTPAVRVTAPGRVEVVLRRKGTGAKVVHLANHTGYQAVTEGSNATNDTVTPVHDVTVSLRDPGYPVHVFDGPTGERLATSSDGIELSVTVPRVDIHTWFDVIPIA